MEGIEVIDTYWCNNTLGTVGIVLAKNGVGEKHVYISNVRGLDEKEDIEQTLMWGNKIKADNLISFIK